MARNEVQIRKNAAKLFAVWRNDWNKFISEALGVTLDEEQQAIVTAVQHKKLVSVRSGTARGKDFVAAYDIVKDWDEINTGNVKPYIKRQINICFV